MSEPAKDGGDKAFALAGTTLKVYRYMYKTGKSVGIHEVQHALGLSSASVASYHMKKLENAGLVAKDENARYYVNHVVFENMIRIRRSLVPLQAAFALSFATAFILLLTLFRPAFLTGGYIFALVMIGLACSIFSYQALGAVKKTSI